MDRYRYDNIGIGQSISVSVLYIKSIYRHLHYLFLQRPAPKAHLSHPICIIFTTTTTTSVQILQSHPHASC